MRILHVTESMLGGVGTYLNELIPRQQQVWGANNIRILVPEEHCLQVPNITAESILTFHRKNRKAGLISLAFAFIKTMHLYRPHLIHAHSTFAGVITRILCLFFNTPVVYCPHGWATEIEQPQIIKRLIAWAEKTLSSQSKTIIAISEHERRIGISIGISPEKITTVYNGLRTEISPSPSITWQDTRLKVLFVGRLDRQKGLDTLLKDKICIRVIGTAVAGGEDPRLALDHLPHVETFGWLNSSEVAGHMAACDVVVIPSRWEGFGLVALEAMRLAKPIFATRVGGLPEVVVDRQTGFLFSPGDHITLRNLLLRADRNELVKMGLAGRQRFLTHFSLETLFSKTSNIYRSIVAQT